MLSLVTIALVSAPVASQHAHDLPPQEPAAPKVRLRYRAPAAGKSATYSFTETSNLAVDQLRSTMNGEVFERKAPDRAVEQIARRVWVDTALEMDKAPTLRRTFVDIGSSMEIANDRQGKRRPDGSARATSPLTGTTVDFVETNSGRVARLPMESESGTETSTPIVPPFPVPEPDLAALSADTTLQALLPGPRGEASGADSEGVAIGETWDVDASAMLGVLCPGGDVPTYYGPIENQRDPDLVARFGSHALSRFGLGIQGDVEAKLISVVPEDGVRVAHIEITFDVSLSRDPAPWMRDQSAPFEMAKIGQTAKNASHTMTAKGKGTLLWDLEHDRFIEFAATAESTSDQRVDYEFEHRGFKLSGAEHFELSGTTSIRLKATYGE